MRVDEAKTREARERHEDGIAALDKLFQFDRKKDGTGFLRVRMLKAIRRHRHIA